MEQNKKKRLQWLGTAALILTFLYFVPLFKVRSLEELSQRESVAFNADKFVEEFWHGPLQELRNQGVSAEVLIGELVTNPEEAAKRYGRSLGISSTTYYLISGVGLVLSLENEEIAIDVNEDLNADPLVNLGPVFGNAIRDGTGLLDINSFANTQDFNAVSFEINRRVEEQVFPVLREQAVPGSKIKFSGAVEVSNSNASLPLLLIPFSVEIN